MVSNLYAIRDVKVGFGVPMVFVNDDVAMRTVASALLAPDNFMSFAPADFALYGIGVYDDTTGFVTADDVPRHICEVKDLIDVYAKE